MEEREVTCFENVVLMTHRVSSSVMSYPVTTKGCATPALHQFKTGLFNGQ